MVDSRVAGKGMARGGEVYDSFIYMIHRHRFLQTFWGGLPMRDSGLSRGGRKSLYLARWWRSNTGTAAIFAIATISDAYSKCAHRGPMVCNNPIPTVNN